MRQIGSQIEQLGLRMEYGHSLLKWLGVLASFTSVTGPKQSKHEVTVLVKIIESK